MENYNNINEMEYNAIYGAPQQAPNHPLTSIAHQLPPPNHLHQLHQSQSDIINLSYHQREPIIAHNLPQQMGLFPTHVIEQMQQQQHQANLLNHHHHLQQQQQQQQQQHPEHYAMAGRSTNSEVQQQQQIQAADNYQRPPIHEVHEEKPVSGHPEQPTVQCQEVEEKPQENPVQEEAIKDPANGSLKPEDGAQAGQTEGAGTGLEVEGAASQEVSTF
jgi:hypothetical protein